MAGKLEDDIANELAKTKTHSPGMTLATAINPAIQGFGQTSLNKPARTIIERIIHIRNEIEHLDAELGKLQSDIAGRIGGGYHK